jgi:tetratricopeptide (TPR) repeat protein
MTADSSAPQTGAEFADQGEAAFKKGNYSGAMYALRHAAVDDPNNAVVTLLLGQALFATGKFDEAAGATQAAMRQLPREKWGVVINHYTELYGDTKDYTRQLRALEAAVKEKPDDPALRFLAGFHYAYLGFTQPAIDQLDKTLKLAPRDEMARQLRDELRGKLGTTAVPPLPPAPSIPKGPALETE